MRFNFGTIDEWTVIKTKNTTLAKFQKAAFSILFKGVHSPAKIRLFIDIVIVY